MVVGGDDVVVVDDVDVADNDVDVDRLEVPLRGGIDLERTKSGFTRFALSLLDVVENLIGRDDDGENASVFPSQRRRSIVDET